MMHKITHVNYKNIWIALFLILVVLEITAWATNLNPNWGHMYFMTDGEWASWKAEHDFQWGLRYGLTSFSMISGTGSLTVPGSVILDPGTAIFLLDLPLRDRYLLSYLIYAIEISACLAFLLRTIGFSWRSALLAVQLNLFMYFPGYTEFWPQNWYQLAPYHAHLLAMWAGAVSSFLRVRSTSLSRSLPWAIGGTLFLLVGLLSKPFTFIAYAPVFFIFGLTLFVFINYRRPTAFLMISCVAIVLGAVISYFGLEYLNSISNYSSRIQYTQLSTGSMEWSLSDAKRILLNGFLYYCPSIPASVICFSESKKIEFFIRIIVIFYAIFVVFSNTSGLKKGFGIAIILNEFFVHCYFAAQHFFAYLIMNLMPNMTFFVWAQSFFYPMVLSILFVDVFRRICGVWSYFRNQNDWAILYNWRLAFSPVSVGASHHCAALLVLISIVAWNLNKSSVDYGENQKKIRFPISNNVVDHLTEEIGLFPGVIFRGSAATFFGPPGSKFLNLLGRNSAEIGLLDVNLSSSHLLHVLGNKMWGMDLWRVGIPTIEKYGQMYTRAAFEFDRRFFTYPGQLPHFNHRYMYMLDIDMLRLLGVRFLITTSRLEGENVRLTSQTSAGSVTLYLYEIENSNLGNYSVLRAVPASSWDATMTLLHRHRKELDQIVILNEDSSGRFERASHAQMIAEKNGFRFVGESSGISFVVLPLEFSNCFKITRLVSRDTLHPPRITRANGYLTGIIFDGAVDVTIDFALGLGPKADCRARDVAQFEDLTDGQKMSPN